jgi:hypothetical protein
VQSLRIFAALPVLAAAFACGSANAGGHVGVFIGGPLYYPVAPVPYYYSPPPPVVAVPAAPQAYVEQGQPAGGSAQSSGYWYYCDASRAYYPYVKQCPGGWREVAPQPAPSN